MDDAREKNRNERPKGRKRTVDPTGLSHISCSFSMTRHLCRTTTGIRTRSLLVSCNTTINISVHTSSDPGGSRGFPFVKAMCPCLSVAIIPAASTTFQIYGLPFASLFCCCAYNRQRQQSHLNDIYTSAGGRKVPENDKSSGPFSLKSNHSAPSRVDIPSKSVRIDTFSQKYRSSVVTIRFQSGGRPKRSGRFQSPPTTWL